jgi:hypothetical protein
MPLCGACDMSAPAKVTTGTYMRDVKALAGLRVCFILSVIACVLGALTTSPALAAPNCTNFFYNSDDSWSPTHPILFEGPTSRTEVMPSDKFRTGMPGIGGRIVASLNASCRYARTSAGTRNIPEVP